MHEEILEMTSERSESSSYLETDSAEKSKDMNSSSEGRRRKKSGEEAPKISVNSMKKVIDGHASTIFIGSHDLL